MLDFTRSLTPVAALRYLVWRLRGRVGPVVLRSRLGPRFEIRPNGLGEGGNNDYGVAFEIFALDAYRAAERLPRDSVRQVVDLGANVGFSLLRWLALFPAAQVLAFEPHPGHAAQAARNVALNGWTQRVEIVQAGAAALAREALLSDGGSGSEVAKAGATIRIRLVDAFPRLLGRRIDLLKLDIEGGEYELLADPRFAALDIGVLLMEWHRRGDAQGRQWCLDRLQELGYRVEELIDEGENGVFWAERASPG
jgi:FkbM family methyltransferase